MERVRRIRNVLPRTAGVHAKRLSNVPGEGYHWFVVFPVAARTIRSYCIVRRVPGKDKKAGSEGGDLK